MANQYTFWTQERRQWVKDQLKGLPFAVTGDGYRNLSRVVLQGNEEDMTFINLQRLSAALGTTDINVISTVERGWYGDVLHRVELIAQIPQVVGFQKQKDVPYFHADDDHPLYLFRELNGVVERGYLDATGEFIVGLRTE